jgi:cation/acetate symporter
MVGTASLPHILMRFFTTPTVREARKSVGWSLFFIFLLYFTAPAYAAFSKFNVMGLFANAPDLQLAFTAIPAWMLQWGSIEGHQLVTICGAKADSLAAIMQACQGKGFESGFPYGELRLNNDMIVLSTPSIAGMPIWVVGLVGAGGFAAALSTADGLLLAIANALSHDVYYKMIDPKADTKTRLMIAKILLVVVAIAAAFLARTKPSDILSMVAWAFSIAAAGLFAPLVMGVWWKRTTNVAAVLGILAGFGITMVYLIGSVYGFDFDRSTANQIRWFGVAPISAGVFGVPVAFLVIYVVSLFTKPPSEEMQDFVDKLRYPKGGAMITQT